MDKKEQYIYTALFAVGIGLVSYFSYKLLSSSKSKDDDDEISIDKTHTQKEKKKIHYTHKIDREDFLNLYFQIANKKFSIILEYFNKKNKHYDSTGIYIGTQEKYLNFDELVAMCKNKLENEKAMIIFHSKKNPSHFEDTLHYYIKSKSFEE